MIYKWNSHPISVKEECLTILASPSIYTHLSSRYISLEPLGLTIYYAILLLNCFFPLSLEILLIHTQLTTKMVHYHYLTKKLVIITILKICRDLSPF